MLLTVMVGFSLLHFTFNLSQSLTHSPWHQCALGLTEPQASVLPVAR